jgi:hypothetical protein
MTKITKKFLIEQLIKAVEKLLQEDKPYGCTLHAWVTYDECRECQQFEEIRQLLAKIKELK